MHLRRLVARLGLVLVLAMIVFAVLLIPLTYAALTTVSPDCEGVLDFTPADFGQSGFDTTPLLMENYETVAFDSREAGIQISAFYIPANMNPELAATILIVHGVAACKSAPNALLPAGMLHRNGFNVLAIDLRDHGESTIEDGQHAAATDEYLDVLGAWDWLVDEKGIPPQRVGVFGYSLGGAASIIAAAEEPRIAVLWTDSAFADVELIIDSIVSRIPTLAWLKPSSLWYGRIFVGDDLLSRKPVELLPRLAGRPLFLVHGDADLAVPVEHAQILASAYPAAELWITEGSQHVESMFRYTDEYEARLIAFFTEHLR